MFYLNISSPPGYFHLSLIIVKWRRSNKCWFRDQSISYLVINKVSLEKVLSLKSAELYGLKASLADPQSTAQQSERAERAERLTWEENRCLWSHALCCDGLHISRHRRLHLPSHPGNHSQSLSCRLCRDGPWCLRSGGNTGTENTCTGHQSVRTTIIIFSI